ncbi:CsbD family protein [Ancylobacter oerskovii]|uniref:CsbD family protein n=1 Tax=Ancylobacter oerskovii TaxID=459519 RepID=A0ABW4Z386_9HYPH|nr:CsbD family protein [Ancylobacter oerskovii]MBS7546155.1 CsbD family protein [Ancylobacter oerskovii]
MMVEIVHSAMRILAGFLKQLSGRTLGDGALQAMGRVDELVGRAALVSVRVRSRSGRIPR